MLKTRNNQIVIVVHKDDNTTVLAHLVKRGEEPWKVQRIGDINTVQFAANYALNSGLRSFIMVGTPDSTLQTRSGRVVVERMVDTVEGRKTVQQPVCYSYLSGNTPEAWAKYDEEWVKAIGKAMDRIGQPTLPLTTNRPNAYKYLVRYWPKGKPQTENFIAAVWVFGATHEEVKTRVRAKIHAMFEHGALAVREKGEIVENTPPVKLETNEQEGESPQPKAETKVKATRKAKTSKITAKTAVETL